MNQEKKRIYNEPAIELLALEVDDVIRTSGNGFSGEEDPLMLSL